MEEQIKSAIGKLRIQYVLFWVLPILLMLAYELNWIPVGIYADDQGMQYIWQTLSIFITVLIVPLSLKYFNVILRKRIDNLSFPVALKQYVMWSSIRLGLLELTVILGVVSYYLTLENVGSLCALIGLTASLFCMPGEKKMREELNIAVENEA